jgi:hypothetical protein
MGLISRQKAQKGTNVRAGLAKAEIGTGTLNLEL